MVGFPNANAQNTNDLEYVNKMTYTNTHTYMHTSHNKEIWEMLLSFFFCWIMI